MRNDYYKTLANPYVRMVGAMVASYFTFGAAYGYLAAAGWSTTAAGVGAGAAAGFVSGAIVTRSIDGGLQGAFSGAIGGGIYGYYAETQSFGRAGVETVAGGVESKIQGGDFVKGMVFAGVIGIVNLANYKMRQYERQQAAQHSYNVDGDSGGFYGDNTKMAGSRRTFAPLLNREICDSTAGGCQGAIVNPGDVRGRLGPINYNSGSALDYVVESFAGPHDWLRDMTGSYDQWGNSYHFVGFAATLDKIRNYVEIPLAAPFAISGLIHETRGILQPVQQCYMSGECK